MNAKWKVRIMNFIIWMIRWKDDNIKNDVITEGSMPVNRELRHTRFKYVDSVTHRPVNIHCIEVAYGISHMDIIRNLDEARKSKNDAMYRALVMLAQRLLDDGYIEEIATQTPEDREEFIMRLRIINPKEYHGE